MNGVRRFCCYSRVGPSSHCAAAASLTKPPFILDQTVEMLNAHSEDVVLKLTTMTSRDELIHCKRYKDITVRGFYSDLMIPLPTVAVLYQCWVKIEALKHEYHLIQGHNNK